MSEPEISRPADFSSPRPKTGRGRSILHGFGKMIFWFALLIVMLVLLSTTSFLSEFILKNLNKVDITVNPIAAASHQTSSAIEEGAATISATDKNTESSGQTGHIVKPANSNKSHAEKNHPAKSDLTEVSGSVANVNEQQKVQQLVAESALERVIDQGADPQTDVTLLPPKVVLDGSKSSAQAIVVLGGGLTRDDTSNIVPNIFTRLRLLQAISQHRVTHLPIFLSGVESPYMQVWLQKQGVTAQWLEARSMNTCENARFSALMLQKLGGAPRVELVTDEWHIPRARWLFAMNGIETVAVPAPLLGDPTPWWPDARNLTHTRRAVHELIAFTRDRWFGVVGCREVP